MSKFYFKTPFDALIGMKFYGIRVLKQKNRKPYSINTLGNYCSGLMKAAGNFDIMIEDYPKLDPKSGDLVTYWGCFVGYIYKIKEGIAYISPAYDDIEDALIESNSDKVPLGSIHDILMRGDTPFPKFYKE